MDGFSTVETTLANQPPISQQGETGETPPTGQALEVCKSFDDIGLKPELLRGIYSYGWEEPTAIQARAIRPFISGVDLISQAQSGKGKTGAFCISSLQIVDENTRLPQVLILSPTRELARQTHEVISKLAIYTKSKCHLSVGGVSVREDIYGLRKNPEIVVGTPGRIMDMIDKGCLKCDQLAAIVLDEADEMLDRGFRDAVYDIFQHMPANVQVVLFSATFPPDCLELSNKFMQNPVKILVKTEELTLEGIRQFYVNCEEEHYKFDVLKELYELISVPQVIIFVKSRLGVDRLADLMTTDGHTVSCIHGAMEQDERTLRMREFRSGASRVLISTDLIARGIDVPAVALVINYDLPFNNYENYLHRIGRSGRHGKKGVAINFLTNHPRDVRTLREIEQYYATKVEELPGDVAETFEGF